LLPQKPAKDLLRQGGGEFPVQGGEEDVSGHEGGDSRTDGAPERENLPGQESVPGRSHHGKHLVGIRGGVPVPREMLSHGEDPAGEHTPEKGDPQFRDDFRIRRKCPVPDHGVFRIAVDVEDGGEVDVHADGAKFLRHRLASGLGNARRAGTKE
jgi:hypothetical protein